MSARARLVPLLMCLLLALPTAARTGRAAAEADAAPTAQADAAAADLTRQCTLEASFPSRLTRLTDGDLESAQRFEAGESVSVSWTEDVPVAAVYFAFYREIAPFTVLQYDAAGALLSEHAPGPLWNNVVEPLPDARRVTIRAEAELAFSAVTAYGEGTIPDYLPFAPTPEKADYLLVAMHPDDDVLFLGGVIPIYGAQQGREGVALYMASRVRVRVNEAMAGAWTMGLRTQPVFGGFPDIPPEYRAQFENTFRSADVVRYLVRQMRRYRPEVVVSQDVNGEYGHWQHALLAKAVLEAAPLAADAEYDPESAAQYGVWQVKKVYLHLYGEGRITLPVTEPLSAFGGRTAVEVAQEAFACHQSQLPSRHAVTNEGIYSLSDFGLAYTAVGADTPGVNDMFEHIDPAVLSGGATPTPEPSPTPSPAPTAAPTAEPAPAPSATPAADGRTPGPDPALPAAGDGAPGGTGALPMLLLCLAAAAAALLAALLLLRRRERRGRRRRPGRGGRKNHPRGGAA